MVGGIDEVIAKAERLAAEAAWPREKSCRLKEYTAAHDKAKSAAEGDTGPVDAAAKLLADMVALGDQITA
jgi:F-type H+-transporting ATPase subunit epsilon